MNVLSYTSAPCTYFQGVGLIKNRNFTFTFTDKTIHATFWDLNVDWRMIL
jgi:hypothetical protein